MKMQSARTCGALTAVLFSLMMVSPAYGAGDKPTTSEDSVGRAEVIERRAPTYPGGQRRATQEGWVLVSYVVSDTGVATDPIVLNSVGGTRFEREVLSALGDWKFVPGDTAIPYNQSTWKFSILGRGKGITRRFARHHRHIMKNINGDDVSVARKQTEEALSMGGWNLYEYTMLWLMIGRIEGADGDPVAKLRAYQRALAVSDDRSLSQSARVTLVEDIFKLQTELGQHAAALATLEDLAALPGGASAAKGLATQSAAHTAALDGSVDVVAKAATSVPCHCAEGVAVWDYAPSRRIFSIENIDGNLGQLDARCEFGQLKAEAVAGKQWTLPDEWGYCRVIVSGEDGTTFDFLGHVESSETDGSGQVAATASERDHVLDKRN